MKTIVNSFLLVYVWTILSYAQNNGSISHSSLFGNPPDSIPKIFATKFVGCYMKIYSSGCQIILESGCKVFSDGLKEKERNRMGELR